MSHHTDDNVDPLKAVREELAGVTPSPEFTARVWRGIDADADARGAGWLSGWRWFVPAAGVAAVVIAVFAIARPAVNAPEAVVATVPTKAQNPITAPRVAVVSSPVAEKASRAGGSNFELRTSKSGRQGAKVEAAIVGAPFPEVITNQPEILRALWARVESNATLVESTPATLPDTVPEVVVKPIEVSPIVVKWLGDPQTAPGMPIIRKVTADTAERSAK